MRTEVEQFNFPFAESPEPPPKDPATFKATRLVGRKVAWKERRRAGWIHYRGRLVEIFGARRDLCQAIITHSPHGQDAHEIGWHRNFCTCHLTSGKKNPSRP